MQAIARQPQNAPHPYPRVYITPFPPFPRFPHKPLGFSAAEYLEP